MHHLFQFVSYLEIYSTLLFPNTISQHYFPYAIAFPNWGLENYHLSNSISICSDSYFVVLASCRTVKMACTPAACIEGGEILPCRVYWPPSLHEYCIPCEGLQLLSFLCGSHWIWSDCRLEAIWLYWIRESWSMCLC